ANRVGGALRGGVAVLELTVGGDGDDAVGVRVRVARRVGERGTRDAVLDAGAVAIHVVPAAVPAERGRIPAEVDAGRGARVEVGRGRDPGEDRRGIAARVGGG